MKAIVNGKIILQDQVLQDRALIFQEKIIGIVPAHEVGSYPVESIWDAEGGFVSHGFIDLHVHGIGGNDVMDGSVAAIADISAALVCHGVTGFLPTTMTMDWPHVEKALQAVGAVGSAAPGARILGCHLEGPFISPWYAGAQDARFVRLPDPDLLLPFRDQIKVVTMAPELEGAGEMINWCKAAGIIVSVGHSNSTYEEAAEAMARGARSATHLFNAMTPLHHRKPGMVGAALENEQVFCELIADNFHVHPAAQRLVLHMKGIDRVLLVTDAMRACGLGDGSYDLGGQEVTVAGSCATLGDGTLAGSVLTMDQALRNFRKNTGISIAEAVKTVTENPADLLNLEKGAGHITVGRPADLVIFDENFRVQHTFVAGAQKYGTIITMPT